MPILLRGCVGIGPPLRRTLRDYYRAVAHSRPACRGNRHAFDAKVLPHHACDATTPCCSLEPARTADQKGAVPEKRVYGNPVRARRVVDQPGRTHGRGDRVMGAARVESVQGCPAASIEVIDPRTVAPLDWKLRYVGGEYKAGG